MARERGSKVLTVGDLVVWAGQLGPHTVAGVPITVFLLDDHEIVRRGIAQLLESEDDIEVVGQAGTAAQALARIPALRPDVAILDVRLPDGEGVSVCREVRGSVEPPPACLMLTSYSDDEALFSAELYTAEWPDPDLLVRTSGEMRVSNFLLWQVAYAEFHVTPVLWPDFTREDLFAAILDYQNRDRRFGRVSA